MCGTLGLQSLCWVAVLQASFHPNETIADVLAHVAQSLEPHVAAANEFSLYVTPPMQRLAATKTLVDLQLVPAAHVYLSWSGPAPAGSCGAYFRPELVLYIPILCPVEYGLTLRRNLFPPS